MAVASTIGHYDTANQQQLRPRRPGTSRRTFSAGRRPTRFADDDLHWPTSDFVEGDPATPEHGLEQGPVPAEGEVEGDVGGVAVGEVGVQVDAEHGAWTLKLLLQKILRQERAGKIS